MQTSFGPICAVINAPSSGQLFVDEFHFSAVVKCFEPADVNKNRARGRTLVRRAAIRGPDSDREYNDRWPVQRSDNERTRLPVDSDGCGPPPAECRIVGVVGLPA